MTDHLPFPQPPAAEPDPALLGNREGDATALELARAIAERDRALAEAKRLRERLDARGLRRVAGVVGEGIGAAVALVLAFGVLVAVVGAVYLVARAVWQ